MNSMKVSLLKNAKEIKKRNHSKISVQKTYILVNYYKPLTAVSRSNRTVWSPIRSVIITSDKQYVFISNDYRDYRP